MNKTVCISAGRSTSFR